MITVAALTKSYGRFRAVDGLTFEIHPGRVTGFVGPNGAGKSTTMRAMVGLVRPDHGEVRYDGVPHHRLARPASEVGAVLDAMCMHPGRSARNHLRALAAMRNVPGRRIDEVLAEVGLELVAERRAGAFSLGMRQRLALAGALLASIGGILAITTELQDGTLPVALMAHPTRWPVILATLPGAAALGLALGVTSAGFGPPPEILGHRARLQLGPVGIGRGRPASPNRPGSDNPEVYTPAGRLHLSLPDWATILRGLFLEIPDRLLSDASVDRLFRAPEAGAMAMGWVAAPEQLPAAGCAMQGSNTRWVATALIDTDRRRAVLLVANDGRTRSLTVSAHAAHDLLSG